MKLKDISTSAPKDWDKVQIKIKIQAYFNFQLLKKINNKKLYQKHNNQIKNNL